MRVALAEFVNRKISVIPVLLPGAPKKHALPLFLKQFTWVDLRNGIVDLRDGIDAPGLDRLQWGINGRKPGVASKDVAGQRLETARSLVAATGYGRRAAEVEALAAQASMPELTSGASD